MDYPGGLHNHSEYSNLRLRDCIIKTEDLLWYAAELGHEVVAITEHEAICNHVKAEKVYKKVKEQYPNFKMIRGNEIYLCRNGLNANNFNREYDRYYHFILLAKDAIGHQQIREISTRAWHRSYLARGMRRVPTYYQDLFDIIGAQPGHIIGSTACLGGALATQILRARKDSSLNEKIKIWINQMDNLFGHGNFFLELQPSDGKEQIYVNSKLVELSKELDIPYIITTDAHYLKKEDRNVTIFKYRSISKKYETADIIISRIAEKKKNINMTFLNAAKSSAVDCRLNSEVNNKWVEDKIKCFEFNENELMKPQINQAYKLNIYDDFIIDNGMNSDNSYAIDEELVEVECFIEEKEGLSDRSKMYWLNRKSGVVYDHADKYIVGSIKKDGDSFVNYEDKFIIDKLVFYPEVKN